MITKRRKLFSFSSDVLFLLATGMTVIAIVVISFLSRITAFGSEVNSYVILTVSFLSVGGCLFATVYQFKVNLKDKRESEQFSFPLVIEDINTNEDVEKSVAKLEEYSKLLEEYIETEENFMERGEKWGRIDNTAGAVNDMLKYEVKRADLLLSIVKRVSKDEKPINRSLFLNGT